MYTRKQYLNKECTHREYYAQYVDTNIINRTVKAIGADRILSSFDQHLKDINLEAWDNVFLSGLPLRIANTMRENGDFPTMTGSVCIVKEAAQQFIEQHKGQTK